VNVHCVVYKNASKFIIVWLRYGGDVVGHFISGHRRQERIDIPPSLLWSQLGYELRFE